MEFFTETYFAFSEALIQVIIEYFCFDFFSSNDDNHDNDDDNLLRQQTEFDFFSTKSTVSRSIDKEKKIKKMNAVFFLPFLYFGKTILNHSLRFNYLHFFYKYLWP